MIFCFGFLGWRFLFSCLELPKLLYETSERQVLQDFAVDVTSLLGLERLDKHLLSHSHESSYAFWGLCRKSAPRQPNTSHPSSARSARFAAGSTADGKGRGKCAHHSLPEFPGCSHFLRMDHVCGQQAWEVIHKVRS